MKPKSNKGTLQLLKRMLETSTRVNEMEQHEPEQQQPPKLKIAARTRQKFDALLQLKKITPPDLDVLNPPETELFYKYLTQLFTEVNGEDRDELAEKIEYIVSDDVNDDIRQQNRRNISNAIAASLKKWGRMPCKAEIARDTGLSRSTIQKHLKEYDPTNGFKQYQYAKTDVMQSVIKAAVNGDMRAAKLYVDSLTKLSSPETTTTVINQQNNYIQLNGKIQYLQDLPEERLKQIEEIISLPPAVKEE